MRSPPRKMTGRGLATNRAAGAAPRTSPTSGQGGAARPKAAARPRGDGAPLEPRHGPQPLASTHPAPKLSSTGGSPFLSICHRSSGVGEESRSSGPGTPSAGRFLLWKGGGRADLEIWLRLINFCASGICSVICHMCVLFAVMVPLQKCRNGHGMNLSLLLLHFI